MTRVTQKQQERFFVEQAAKLLGKTWVFEEDRERPDFIVSGGEHHFGLEVCQILRRLFQRRFARRFRSLSDQESG
jgi:hypothetical protein